VNEEFLGFFISVIVKPTEMLHMKEKQFSVLDQQVSNTVNHLLPNQMGGKLWVGKARECRVLAVSSIAHSPAYGQLYSPQSSLRSAI